MENYQITEFCHHFVADHVKEGDFCIDATAGRGSDTVFLCSLVGDHGRVLAFDIQPEAVEAASARIFESGCGHIASVIEESHEQLALYAEPDSVSCIMFNFGYLPGGDHSIATTAETSIRAIEAGLSVLKKKGLMSLCIYSGGDTGYEERDALLAFLQELDPKKYMVLLSRYYNRPNDPPIPAFILKL